MAVNIAVLVSGGGSNLQALIDAQKAGGLGPGKITLVLSGNKNAFALTRAEKEGIPHAVIDQTDFPDPEERDRAIQKTLLDAGAELVVLAGYMNVLGPGVVSCYLGRMVNIHPSLIPRHCGRGMYGIRVHRSVLAAGDAESGATVHLVDQGVDTGQILIQEKVPVLPGDTDKTLAARVLAVEHQILPRAVSRLAAELECHKKENK